MNNGGIRLVELLNIWLTQNVHKLTMHKTRVTHLEVFQNYWQVNLFQYQICFIDSTVYMECIW